MTALHAMALRLAKAARRTMRWAAALGAYRIAVIARMTDGCSL